MKLHAHVILYVTDSCKSKNRWDFLHHLDVKLLCKICKHRGVSTSLIFMLCVSLHTLHFIGYRDNVFKSAFIIMKVKFHACCMVNGQMLYTYIANV